MVGNEEEFFEAQRQQMVDKQLLRRDIVEPRVLQAMRNVPRHLFVPPENRRYAYADGPIPIGQGQTISQPYIVALMTQLLGLDGDENVLEVGTGSGYQAAILSAVASQVHTIERHPDLAQKAKQVLDDLQIKNIQVHTGDGSLGLPGYAPYDAIMVTAAAPQVPPALFDQLAEKGRLVIPVGSRGGQYLELWERKGTKFSQELIIPVAFVPLVGEFGWKEGY
jgi:protein-L-isoaspartate(D-aspartate) O-methyltransferase